MGGGGLLVCQVQPMLTFASIILRESRISLTVNHAPNGVNEASPTVLSHYYYYSCLFFVDRLHWIYIALSVVSPCPSK